MNNNAKKITVVLAIVFLIATIFIVGIDWADDTTFRLYHSYYADFVLPFSYYFLLTLNAERSIFFDRWWKRALAVFVLCTTSEILQYFGIYAFARVFDPLDIVMYGAGSLLAASVEIFIFQRIFPFWKSTPNQGVL